MKSFTKLFSLIVFAILFTNTVIHSQNFWQPTAPLGGIVNSIIRSPNGTLYAGSYGLGVYQSTDNGETWEQTSLTDAAVWCQAVDSGGTIYVGTVGTGVLKSSDGGSTWARAQVDWEPSTLDVRSIIIAKDGSILIGTWGNGAFRMKKGDSTWARVDSGLTNLNVISLCIRKDGRIYAGTDGPLFVSSDTCRSWSVDSSLSSPGINALTTDAQGNLWAATNGGLFRLADYDTSRWIHLGPNFSTIAVCVPDSGLVIASLLGGWLLRSTNGGSSWSQLARSSGLPGEDVKSILPNPITNDIFIATWGGGVYRSTDRGDSWHQVDLSCVNIESFLVDSAGTVLVGTDAAGVFRSTDGGTSWAENSLINSYVYSFGAMPNGKLILSANNGLYRSTDDGVTWNHLNADYWANLNYVRDWVFSKDGKVFGATGRGIYVSTDDGDTWSGPICPSSSAAGGAIAIDSNGTIYAAWDTLFESSDGGESWKPLWAGGVWIYTILSLSNGIILLGTATGVYRSIDSGNSWLLTGPGPQSSGPFFTVRSLKINSAGQIFAATYGGGVYVSKDSGLTWAEVNSGLPTGNIQSIGLSHTGKAYAATRGAGVFVAENATSIRVAEKPVASRYTLFQNYPNPFNPSTLISYQLSAASHVTLTIYDALGRKLETLVNERQTAGNHSVIFNGSYLPSGVYFYRLQVGTFSQSRKMVLVK